MTVMGAALGLMLVFAALLSAVSAGFMSVLRGAVTRHAARAAPPAISWAVPATPMGGVLR